MLDKLRSTVNSWPAKILLCLILLSFVAWGGRSAFENSGSDTLLTSSDNSVSAEAYDATLRNEVLRLSMRIGRYLTPEEIKRFGLESAVYSMLYNNLLFDDAAQKLHIGVSDKNAAELLAHDSLFSGGTGKFDIAAFNFYLQNLRMKREAFLDRFYIQAARRGQLISALQDGIDAPAVFYKALALYQLQTRNIDYAIVSPSALDSITEPDNAALSSWFRINKEQFRTPEYRQISYITLQAEDISGTDKIDDAATAAYYKAHKKQFLETAEKRSFDLIRFSDKNSADSAYAGIETALKSGKTPQEAFEQAAVKIEHRDSVTQESLPTLLGAEIFALKPNMVSSVINDLQGPVLIYVRKIEEAKMKPLAAAAEQIRHDIAREKTEAALPEYRKKIEDLRYDGASLKEIAAQYHLTLHTVTLDNKGNSPQGKFSDFPQSAAILPHIFSAAENIDADPINLNNGGYLWYNVNKIIASRDSALEEVRIKVAAAWKEEKIQQNLDIRATELTKLLSSGDNFPALAEKNNLKLQHIDAISRNSTQDKLSDQAVSSIFSVSKGESGLSVGSAADTRVIFRVNAITEPENPGKKLLADAEKTEAAASFKTDILTLYLRAQALQTPIRVNKTVQERLMQTYNSF